MTNIVERLRDRNPSGHLSFGPWKLMEEAADEIERLRAALTQIDNWSRAYPLKIFPKPDLEKAALVLHASGMTLDAISADAMRHVVEEVGKMARAALAPHEQCAAKEE